MRLAGAWLAALLLLLSPAAVAQNDDKRPPLLELGIGGGGGYVPDYPGAGQNHFNGIALPYVIYRGDILRAGDKAVLRGRLIHNDRIDFDISLDGSFSADSDDNDARRGMPDLDYLGEVGPRLQINLARAARDAKIDLELPLRAVFSTDITSDLSYRGITFHPELAYQHADFLDSGTAIKLGIGPIFASAELMDYFYEVEPRFATATRPAFQAKAGYLGSQVSMRALHRFGNRVAVFALGNIGLYQGAANKRSPLLRDETTLSVGLGLTWSFYQSDARGSE